jgi:MBG domain
MTRGSDCQGSGNISKQVTLVVNAPTPTDTTPPVITHTLNPVNPDGANGWYKSNVSLTWSVTDPESPNSVTKTGCVNQNITSDQAATTYSCSATSPGGSAGPVNVSIKRDATPPTNIQFVGGIGNGDSFPFGSVPNAPTCTADGAVSGLASPCAVTGYSNAVGSHTLTATATDNAGNSATQPRTYTVTKATQSITGFGPIADKTYGDDDFQVSATGGGSGKPVTFAAAGNCEVTGTTVHITGAGNCTVTASQEGNDNYFAAEDVAQSFTIEQAATTTKITCDAGPFTYNGSAHTPCQATVTGFGLNAPVTVDYTNNVNAGTATAKASYAGDTNYKPSSSEQKTFTIDKADATIDVKGYTGVYDGNEHGATGTATGVNNENLSSLLDLGAKYTNVPGGPANWSFAGNGNYNSKSGTANIVITKADATVQLSGLGPYIYDGTAKAATATTNPSGLSVQITYSQGSNPVTNPTNVGSYEVLAKITDNNYQGQTTGTLVISPWNLKGFYQPVDMGDVLNTVKNGSTVPVKFELFKSVGGTELTSTGDVSSISAKTVSCTAFTGDPEDAIETVATGGTSLRYDTTGGQFIYNWQTPKKPNTCYNLTMTAKDGSTISAYFKLK